MTTGEKIKYYRTACHMSQVSLASALHTYQQTIGKYESNERKPKPEHLEKMIEIFGCTPLAFSDTPTCAPVKSDGDFFAYLISFLNAGVIEITGERESDSFTSKLKPETVKIVVSHNLPLLECEGTSMEVTSPWILERIVDLECINHICFVVEQYAKDEPSDYNREWLQEVTRKKEEYELDCQHINDRANTKGAQS